MTKSFKKIGFIWLVVVALAGATLPVYSQEFVVKKIKLRGVQYHPDQGVSTRELEQKVNAWRWESYPENKLSLEDLEDLAYRVSKFYQDLGFRITRSGNTYHNCVSANNRFTIMLNSFGSTKRIDSVICETDDVFNTTAYYVNKDVPLKKYNTKPTNFKKLNYKITGYNCIASGNENSYSIENSINSISELFNVIFRMRKQHLHIEEHTLKEHLDEQFN